MDKSLVEIEEKIYKSSDVMTCMKNLNLELDSYFWLLLEILEENIINYHEWYDYDNLKKVANYIKHIYNKLKLTSKSSYRREIIWLLKIYKQMSEDCDKENSEVFKTISNILSSLLEPGLNKPDPLSLNENPLATLLIDGIFVSRKLEYVDKILKIDANLLNIKVTITPLFILVINEYLKEISNKNNYLEAYYERVINKFLINDAFDLDINLQSEAINNIVNFINNNKLESKIVIRLKKIISSIKDKKDIFELCDINNVNIKASNLELEKLNQNKENSKRVKLNDYIVTIDDKDTYVLDDALSVSFLKNGNVLLKVHIADPLAVISYNSPIIDAAKVKTMTIYLRNEQIPMIDYKLASDDLSLVKGKDRYAKTFCFECDKDGNILKKYFLNTVINVSERATYTSINENYKLGGRSKEEEKVFVFLGNFLGKLKSNFKNVERFMKYESNLDILETKNKLGSFGTDLVTYCMLLTGKSVAEYFKEHNLPYLYRCHELDDSNIKLITNLILNPDNSYYKKTLANLRGNTPKSFYSRFNCGHYGLGFASYSHITSPLRRFSDLLNMHILDMCYFNMPNDEVIKELEIEIDKVAKILNLERNTIEDYVMYKENKKSL